MSDTNTRNIRVRNSLFALFLVGCAVLLGGALPWFGHYLYADMAHVPMNPIWVMVYILMTSCGGSMLGLSLLVLVLWQKRTGVQDDR